MASALLLAGCAGTPSVSGVRGASPSPETPWTPPPDALPRIAEADTSAAAAVPPDIADRVQRLTLDEIVELGLRNNPTTRLAWANAQTAASVYGSERGAWLPTIDGDVSAARLKTAASQGRSAVQQSVLTPSVTLTYLLFDFGGRSGRVERGAAAAGVGELHPQRHDPGRGAPDPGLLFPVSGQPRAAGRRSAPRWRRRTPTSSRPRSAGVSAWPPSPTSSRRGPRRARPGSTCRPSKATLQTTRGALALALGLPANLCLRRGLSAALAPGRPARRQRGRRSSPTALQDRPDLAAAQAEAEAAQAAVGEVRAAQLPSLASTRPAAGPTPRPFPTAPTATACRSG